MFTVSSKDLVLQKAYVHWMSFIKEAGSTPEASLVSSCFDNLVTRYTEPHRRYHTLEHIVSMLDEFMEVRIFLISPLSVQGGIWFHDVIYDVHSNCNEEASAQYAYAELVQLGVSESLILTVCHMIRVSDHKSSSLFESLDTQLFLDLDVAILGKSWSEFLVFESGIRYEYQHVPELVYCRERIKVLEALSSQLYMTEYGKQSYQLAASRNLKRMIAILRKRMGKRLTFLVKYDTIISVPKSC